MNKENIVTIKDLISLFTKCAWLVGFAIFAIYFFEIKFVSVNSWESLLGITIFAAILGGVILFSLGCMMVWSPMYWLFLFEFGSVAEIIVGKEHADYCKAKYKSGYIDVPKVIGGRIFLWYVLPISGFMLIDFYFLYNKSFKFWLYGGLIFYFLSKIIFLSYESRLKKFLIPKLDKIEYARESISVLLILIFSCAASFFIFIALIGIRTFYPQGSELSFSNHIEITILLIVISSCGLIPANDKIRIEIWMLFVGLIGAIVLFVFTNTISEAVNRIIHTLKFGNMTNMTMMVDQIGCNILTGNNANICSEDKAYTFKVDVLWRIGEYYVRYETENEETQAIIPKKHVLGLLAEHKLKDRKTSLLLYV